MRVCQECSWCIPEDSGNKLNYAGCHIATPGKWDPQDCARQDAKCRACMCRVPFAKPGKDSMDLEVFGMAGVPEGAMPGVPPPDGEQNEAFERLHHACIMPGIAALKGANVWSPSSCKGLPFLLAQNLAPLSPAAFMNMCMTLYMSCQLFSHMSFWVVGRCPTRAC